MAFDQLAHQDPDDKGAQPIRWESIPNPVKAHNGTTPMIPPVGGSETQASRHLVPDVGTGDIADCETRCAEAIAEIIVLLIHEIARVESVKQF